MKILNKFLFSAVAATFALTSCTGDLDLLPTDPNNETAEKFKDDPNAMDRVMADVYMQYVNHGANNNSSVSGFDGGMSSFQRAAFILEEVPSDEANWIPADADYGTFQYGIVPANNRVILGTYSRFMINVTLCNDFIQTVNNGLFYLPTDELKARSQEFIRECKVLRSGAYFYLIDNFGNVPYANEDTPTGSVPEQKTRAELFKLVVADLEAVVKEYEESGIDPMSVPYGYVGQEVAEALLVKFYLNAQVYTGTPEWANCLKYAQRIINRHKGTGFVASDGTATGLCKHYHHNFCANNDQYSIGGSNAVSEIIWNLPADYDNLLAWAGSTFMLMGWIGEPNSNEKYDYAKRYNAGDKWKCMSARDQFVLKFHWTDGEMTESDDSRVALWGTSKDGYHMGTAPLDQLHYGDNGYCAVKFTNWALDEDGNIDEAASPAATNQIGTDYPMIRLAEIYLSAAEAILNGVGSREDALAYVNYIRERAGVEKWNSSDLTASSLRDERCRELYTECTRRSDLIRYNQWISGYTWNWKNQIPTGADFLPNFNLYPLPSTTVSLTGYKQNPGY